MTNEEMELRDKQYNLVYDSFLRLINKEIDVAIVPVEVMSNITIVNPYGDLRERHNFGDILRELCSKNNLVQTYDVFSNSFEFRRGGNDADI